MRGIKLNFFGNCFNFNSYPPHGQFGCCQNRTTRLFDALSIMTSLGSASYSTGLAIGALFGGKHSTTSTSANKNQLPNSLSEYYAMQNPMFYGGMNGFMPTGMMNYPNFFMPMPQVDLFNPTSSYTDLFNETFTPEKTEGKTDIKNVNYDKNGKKIGSEYITKGLNGNIDVRFRDAEGNTHVLSSTRKEADGTTVIEKEFPSLDGTITTTSFVAFVNK